MTSTRDAIEFEREVRRPLPSEFDGAVSGLSPEQLIAGIRADRAAIDALEARCLAQVSELYARREEENAARVEGASAGRFIDDWDLLSAEVGAALGVTRGTAAGRIHQAVDLRERLPQVFALFAQGMVTMAGAGAAVRASAAILDDRICLEFDGRLAEFLRKRAAKSDRVLSPRAIRSAADKIVAQLDPEAAEEEPLAKPTPRIGFCGLRNGFVAMDALMSKADAIRLSDLIEDAAETVCKKDGRRIQERQVAALIALVEGYETIGCRCEDPACEWAARRPRTGAVAKDLKALAVIVLAESDFHSDGDEQGETPSGACAGAAGPGAGGRGAGGRGAGGRGSGDAGSDDAGTGVGGPGAEAPDPDPDAGDRPVTDRPVTDRPVTDRPVTDRPVTDRDDADRDGADRDGADPDSTTSTEPRTGAELRTGAEPVGLAPGAPDDGYAIVVTRNPDISGPVPVGQARELIAECDTRVTSLGRRDEATGEVHATGSSGYRPTEYQLLVMAMMYPTCVFPNCTVPASRCQADHVGEYDHRDPARGGPTTVRGRNTGPGNLVPLCRFHHAIKTESGWLSDLREDGAVLWRHPAGGEWVVDPGTDPLPGLDGVIWDVRREPRPAASADGLSEHARERNAERRRLREQYRRIRHEKEARLARITADVDGRANAGPAPGSPPGAEPGSPPGPAPGAEPSGGAAPGGAPSGGGSSGGSGSSRPTGPAGTAGPPGTSNRFGEENGDDVPPF